MELNPRRLPLWAKVVVGTVAFVIVMAIVRWLLRLVFLVVVIAILAAVVIPYARRVGRRNKSR
jgi:hypothetical protein